MVPASLRLTRRSVWVLALALSLVLTLAATAAAPLRSSMTVLAPLVSLVLVLVGVRLHRPRTRSWVALVLVVTALLLSRLLILVEGGSTWLSDVLSYVGLAVGLAFAVVLTVPRSRSRSAPTSGRVLDVVVVVTVLGLVCAQLVAAGVLGGQALSGLVVPTVDVLILGIILRFVVTRHLSTPLHLLAAAAFLGAGSDLLAAALDVRTFGPGVSDDVPDILYVLLFGVAALHPAFGEATDLSRPIRRRRESSALLGLLPLVAVPVALWWVAGVTGVPALSSWVLLLAGTLVAALSLLRAVGALRVSEHVAEHDVLTGLVDREGLAVTFELAGATDRTSVLLVDVDDFKQVNDIHGHDVGDALLVQVRDRLLLAAVGHVVARVGGDEFVVLARDDDPARLAQQILRSLRVPVRVGDLTLRTGASIGVVRARAGEPLVELLARADLAMYAAKAAGRDTATEYDPAMREEMARRFALTAQVRRLLAGDRDTVGGLELLYQPLVRLGSGRVVGAEALVRWRHPEHGLLGPCEFLGIVSDNGLDADLDRLVLAEVLEQLARWRALGLAVLPVSVNLTRDSLAHPDLAARVLAALAQAEVPAELLTLEITEHQELPSASSAAQSLRTLLEAGVHTHLDDFGVGFTSLDYLHRFPVGVLKLDRSLVGAMSEYPQLIAGIAAMAAAMDLQLLAEGVETVEQHEQLLALGVTFGQGYLFSRPLDAERFRQAVLVPSGQQVVVPGPRQASPPVPRGSTTGEPVLG